MIDSGFANEIRKKKIEKAWYTIFRYYYQKPGKGNIPYRNGEKIYIKLNMPSASNGINTQYERIKCSESRKDLIFCSDKKTGLQVSSTRRIATASLCPKPLVFTNTGIIRWINSTRRTLEQEKESSW